MDSLPQSAAGWGFVPLGMLSAHSEAAPARSMSWVSSRVQPWELLGGVKGRKRGVGSVIPPAPTGGDAAGW